MNVLMLAAEFPPVNTTGNFRTARFVKYLPENHIRPIVVTLDETDGSIIFNRPVNPQLLKDIPVGVPVLRFNAKLKQSFNRFSFFAKTFFQLSEPIGPAIYKQLVPELPGIIADYKIKAIYVSCPPFSMGDLALKIAKKFQLPLVIDMRDAWAEWTTTPHKTFFHYLLKRKKEHEWFRYADAVVCVTEELANVFHKAHNDLPRSKFMTVYNGLNDDIDFRDVRLAAIKEKQLLSIGYVGSFYFSPKERQLMFQNWWRKPVHKMMEFRPTEEDWLYRSPYFIFKTVHQLKKIRPDVGSRIRIEFAGEKPEWLDTMINEFGLKDQVVHHGFLDRDKLINVQNSWDILLATSEKIINGRNYCLPSKLFEYLGSSKPIFGFVTEGEQADFLRKSGLAEIFNPDDIDGSVNRMIEILESGANYHPNRDFLSRFNGHELTKQLSNILHSVASGSGMKKELGKQT